MAKKFDFFFTPRAEQDLDDILDYISNSLKNPKAAADLYKELLNAIDIARTFPLAAPTSNLSLSVEVRKLIVQNYIAFYTIDLEFNNITILRVRYASSDLFNLI